MPYANEETLKGMTKIVPLTDRQKEFCVSTILRSKQMFKFAATRLTVAVFLQKEAGYATLWECLLQFYQENKRLPTLTQITAELEARVHSNPELMTEEQLGEVDELLQRAYETPRKEFSLKLAKQYLGRWLEERLFRQLRSDIEQGPAPALLPAILERTAKELRSVHAVSTAGLTGPFPVMDSDEEQLAALEQSQNLMKVPTGLEFLDPFLGGGQAPGEVYGAMGPIAGGKTTLGVMLSGSVARNLYAEYIVAGQQGPMPVIYMVYWEEPLISVRARLLSYIAGVPKEDMEEFCLSKLSTSADETTYKDYELRRYSSLLALGERPPGERERILHAIRISNACLVPIDFTGAKQELAAFAPQMTAGLLATIEADQQERGNPGIAMVIADHAHAAAVQHCSNKGLDPSKHMPHLLSQMPLDLKTQLAGPFKCPVWLFHQLKAASNSQSAGVVPSSADAMWAKNFAEFCDFCIVMGTKNKDDLMLIANGKPRRTGQIPPRIIHLDGRFATMHDRSSDFVLDGKKIVEKSDYSQYAPGAVDDEEMPTERARPAALVDDSDDPDMFGVDDREIGEKSSKRRKRKKS